MNQDQFNTLIDNIHTSLKTGAKAAAPTIPGVIRSSQAVVSELKASYKEFQDKERRVKRKLRSGTRRTQSDPV